jgi:hypothetical protein
LIPYDGNGIGSFKSDILRRLDVNFIQVSSSATSKIIVINSGLDYSSPFHVANGAGGVWNGEFEAYITGSDFGNETAPASISCLYCISY